MSFSWLGNEQRLTRAHTNKSSLDNFKKVSAFNSVRAELIDEHGEARYRITDILIGKEDGLGVENLRYSGMIAGESLQAYNVQ